MGRKVAGYLMTAITLHILSGILLAAETDYPASSKFGVQRFSEKKMAPPFSLKMADGNQVSLSDLKGKSVMFTFWASWCETCREEIPLIEKFSQGKQNQMTVFLVAIDGENEKRIQRLIKDRKITLPVLLDMKEKIARTYGIRMVPTTFLINSEGMMVGMVVGEREWNSPEAWSAMKELFALR
jgi:peroxiredoxin